MPGFMVICYQMTGAETAAVFHCAELMVNHEYKIIRVMNKL